MLSRSKKSYENLKQALEPSIFHKTGIKHPLLEYRTPFDRSAYGCIENVIRGFVKSFLIAYGIKAGVKLLTVLIKLSKNPKNFSMLLQALVGKGNIKLGLFMGSLTGIMKLVIALSRIVRKKDDGLNGFLGGFIAGWISFFFVEKNTRLFLACLLLSRAFDCYYNHLVNKGVIKKSAWHYTYIFAVLNMLTGYGYAHEKHIISPSLDGFYNKMICLSGNDSIMVHLWHEMTRRRLEAAGVIKEPFLIKNYK